MRKKKIVRYSHWHLIVCWRWNGWTGVIVARAKAGWSSSPFFESIFGNVLSEVGVVLLQLQNPTVLVCVCALSLPPCSIFKTQECRLAPYEAILFLDSMRSGKFSRSHFKWSGPLHLVRFFFFFFFSGLHSFYATCLLSLNRRWNVTIRTGSNSIDELRLIFHSQIGF